MSKIIDVKLSGREAIPYVKIAPKIDMYYSCFTTSEAKNEKIG